MATGSMRTSVRAATPKAIGSQPTSSSTWGMIAAPKTRNVTALAAPPIVSVSCALRSSRADAIVPNASPAMNAAISPLP